MIESKKLIRGILSLLLLVPQPTFSQQATAQPSFGPGSQRYPVFVTPGTPSIWSMEQAHYLLNRLRASNDSLNTTSPSAEQLDSNATNAIRLSATQSQLGVAGSFDQQVAVANRIALADYQNAAAQRDGARKDVNTLQQRLNEDQLALAAAKGEKAKYDALKAAKPANAPADPDLDAAIAEATGKVTGLDERVKADKEQLATAKATLAPPSLQSAPATPDLPPQFARLLEDSSKALLKKTADSFNSPKLGASIMLHNFLQMQYEILSTQLTALRDEAGKGQRLIFLEMPTSINSADRKAWGVGGEDKLAQSWWRVDRIRRRYKIEDSACWAGQEGADRFYSLIGNFDSEGIASINAANRVSYFPTADESKQTQSDEQSKQTNSGSRYQIKSKKGLASPSTNPQAPSDKVNATPSIDTQPSLDQIYKLLDALATAVADSSNPVAKAQKELKDLALKLAAARGKDLASRRSELLQYDDRKRDREFDALLQALRPIEANCVNQEADTKATIARIQLFRRSVADAQAQQAMKENEAKDRLEVLKSISELFADRVADRLGPLQIELIKEIGGIRYLSVASYTNISANPLDQSGQVRAVEVIPSQTSLNVNTANVSVKDSRFAASLKWLFGVGLKVDYQQQKELYDQFLQQETFASGFGKGRPTFGWTFGALPGARVINSGVRTTYVAMVVPDDASALEVASVGCAFHRTHRPPVSFPSAEGGEDHCGTTVNALLGIPSRVTSGGLRPSAMEFQTAAKGNRINIILRGSYFSPQTTVLVNGKRLTQVLGLGKPVQAMDAGPAEDSPDGAITGTFEYVNETNITLSLAIPKSYDRPGFPTITLVAPMSAVNLNGLDLIINGEFKKLDSSVSLFPKAPAQLSFKEFRLLRTSDANHVQGYLTGTELTSLKDHVRLNGLECDNAVLLSGEAALVTCQTSDSPDWVFTGVSHSDPEKATVASLSVVNPNLVSISSYQVVDAATQYADDAIPKHIELRLIGTGFTQRVQLGAVPDPPNRFALSFVSSTEMLLKVERPAEQETVQVIKGTEHAAVVVTRPPNKQPSALDPSIKTTVTTTQSERKTITK